MKVSDIKTEFDFYQFMLIQYRRANMLIAIWNDKSQPEERRTRAYKLWEIQDERVEQLKELETQAPWKK